jgi:hypothetical protein
MANWRLAKSLEKLRIQINAAHPTRSRVSDGSVGDISHSKRKSDHNPNARGVVTAIDITHDPANGVDCNTLSHQLVKDRRTKYIIWNSKIYRRYKPELGWAAYTGSNPHDKHLHISVLGAAGLYDADSPWDLAPVAQSPVNRRTLKRGDEGDDVKELQRRLGVVADGIFGANVEHAVREFQAHHKLTVDGRVGPATYAAMFKT